MNGLFRAMQPFDYACIIAYLKRNVKLNEANITVDIAQNVLYANYHRHVFGSAASQ
jgi:hypothetical protein